jgi:hypothetical protein
MRKTLWILAFVAIAAICAPAAHTGTKTTYNITFTGGSPNPTMGSFTYDSTNPQFSNFTVLWDGITFDLTSSANSPTFCDPGCKEVESGAKYAFRFLSGPTRCKPAPGMECSSKWTSLNQVFSFMATLGPGSVFVIISGPIPLQNHAGSATGTWTIAAVP